MAAFPDSELEVLRRSKNDEDDEALDLEARLPFWRAQGKKLPMKKAAGQQAGWLAVGIIVRFLDGTPVGTKGDWKDLAGCLGLDILTINVCLAQSFILPNSLGESNILISFQRIDNFASSRTGATLEVLSDYTMSQKSTVGELVEALHTLGRMDVLLAISPHLELLLDPSKRSPSPASFKSLPPALMSSSSEDEMVVRVEGQPDMPNLESSPFVMMGSSPPTKELSPTRIRKYVMLTFAQDGYELAKEVAALARTSLSHLGLGILILEENREELEFCTESIYRWYQEVKNPYWNPLGIFGIL